MFPIVKASVPLLEPPGWAIAQRELFTLLDPTIRGSDPCQVPWPDSEGGGRWLELPEVWHLSDESDEPGE